MATSTANLYRIGASWYLDAATIQAVARAHTVEPMGGGYQLLLGAALVRFARVDRAPLPDQRGDLYLATLRGPGDLGALLEKATHVAPRVWAEWPRALPPTIAKKPGCGCGCSGDAEPAQACACQHPPAEMSTRPAQSTRKLDREIQKRFQDPETRELLAEFMRAPTVAKWVALERRSIEDKNGRTFTDAWMKGDTLVFHQRTPQTLPDPDKLLPGVDYLQGLEKYVYKDPPPPTQAELRQMRREEEDMGRRMRVGFAREERAWSAGSAPRTERAAPQSAARRRTHTTAFVATVLGALPADWRLKTVEVQQDMVLLAVAIGDFGDGALVEVAWDGAQVSVVELTSQREPVGSPRTAPCDQVASLPGALRELLRGFITGQIEE